MCPGNYQHLKQLIYSQVVKQKSTGMFILDVYDAKNKYDEKNFQKGRVY